MKFPLNIPEMSIKDWIWVIGSGMAVVGSWAVLGSDVSNLKAAVASQVVIDNRQNDIIMNLREEILLSLRRLEDAGERRDTEIKDEIRELRREIQKMPSKKEFLPRS